MSGNRKRGFIIQKRELAVLGEAGTMLVADREQFKCAGGFGSTTRVNARLLALTRAGLLRRVFLGVNGAVRKALYTLSPKGAALVNIPYRGLRRGRDEVLVADFFVNHQLHVNDLYCILKHRPIPIDEAKFLRWECFRQPIDDAESLIPDGYVEVERADTVMAAFLEVDLGHERGSVWPKKAGNYVRYAVSGEFGKRFAQPQFRTLVVTNSGRRMDSLRARTAPLTHKVFWFTTFEEINSEGFWSPIWHRPTGDTRLPLL